MVFVILTVTAALLAAAQDEGPLGVGAAGDPPRPAMVTLDFENHTLAEIVGSLERQGPNRVTLGALPPIRVLDLDFPGARPRRDPEPEPRRFRLQEKAPVPFWEAIDQVCRLTERRPVLEHTSGTKVVLAPAAPEPGFVSQDGAFRVVLVALNYDRRVQFAPFHFPRPEEQDRVKNVEPPAESFRATIVIMPEPRLQIARIGPVTALEVRDDRGRSLLAPGSERQSPLGARVNVERQVGGAPVAIRLRYPDDPGSFIRQFQGVVSLDLVGTGDSGPIRMSVRFEFTNVPMP